MMEKTEYKYDYNSYVNLVQEANEESNEKR